MKSMKLILALAMMLVGGKIWAITAADLDSVREYIPLAKGAIKGLISKLKDEKTGETVAGLVGVGFDTADLGLNAEKKIGQSKDAMKNWLVKSGENQPQIKELTKKFAAATSDDEKIAILIQIHELGTEILDLEQQFLLQAGDEIIARALQILEGISGSLKEKMTFANGKTMGEQLGVGIKGASDVVAFDKTKVTPRLKESLSKKGIEAKKAQISAPADNPFGDL